ncbi:thymidylate synthase [Natronosporangium hydrolyticum]|uniref:Thymidylate synthase n=1 Tax=Natronosporangium hydrolyticum TaxID=2811111 RepID=A0A895Y9N2_9ACTN|nr:thymidylate synthase [Natronosporangium hydrolyticum]QSB12972.1 thymidylate synthase [Natronosporangium hydrolyticum]
MVHGPTFHTFRAAYVAVLRHIATAHQYETATRGKHALEVVNTSFTITDPVARTPYLAARRTNVIFNHAEALWYLTGRDDIDMIGYYAPRLRTLATADGRLSGTAYGPRLFRPTGPDRCSQFDRVIALLRDDPDAKRGAMIIMRPEELVDPANPDVACTLGLQLMRRGGRLHATAYMRGNDAVLGLLCDTFSFTFIQEFAARLLGVAVGSYAHHVGSMHINKADLAKVTAILDESEQAPHQTARFPAAPMPLDTSWRTVEEVLRWEDELRHDRRALSPAAFAGLPLAAYWREVAMLFEVYRQITHHPDQPVDPATLALLRPGHRWLVEQRWPERMPATAGSGP